MQSPWTKFTSIAIQNVITYSSLIIQFVQHIKVDQKFQGIYNATVAWLNKMHETNGISS